MLKLINYEFKCNESISRFDNCMWHNGKVVEIKTPEKSYEIYATGMIDCELIAKKDYIDEDNNQFLKNDVIAIVKDEDGIGLFRKNMEKHIKSDDKLRDLLLGKDEDFSLHLLEHNLLYLYIFDKNGNESSMNELNVINVSDAIKLAMKIISEDKKNNIPSNAIYCRSALINNDAIENQKQLCLQKLEKENKNIKSVICYIDNGFPSTDKVPPAMRLMLGDINHNNLKKVYTHSITRLSRNIGKFIDIREVLKNNGADIFLIKENNYLYKELFNELPVSRLSCMIEPQIKMEKELEDEIERE